MIALHSAPHAAVAIVARCALCGQIPEPDRCRSCEDRTDRLRRAEAATLHRLAGQAHTAGVKIAADPERPTAMIAIDPAYPAEVLVVTAVSCTCAVSVRHHHCRHMALLHAHQGFLAPIACPECAGSGIRESGPGAFVRCHCPAGTTVGIRPRAAKAVTNG